MLRRLALALAVSAAAGCPSDPAAVPDAAYGVCADELDNDGDGSIDFPADPGCNSLADNDEANAPIAACHDGRDNDGDGAIDYPDDPGCYTVLQASEVDDCPDGPTCPACGNGVDDDDDGLVDFPDDPGCVAASDDEFSVDPNACGPGLLVQLVQGGATGTVPGTPSNLASPTCGGGGGEAAYQVSFTEPSVLVATTDLPGTTMDTVLYLRTDCLDPATELACNNNTGEPGVTTSRIVATLDPGTYYLVVDADSAASGGTYQLQVDLLRGEGQACANQGECGPGLQCRTPMGETAMICAQPVCNDADDEDGDTFAGYPDDPGCVDALDFDEADDCPSGPACPMCGNGVDDEGDGAIDYPDDPDCVAASTPVEGCSQESDPVLPMTGASLSGDTTDATDNFWSTCGFEGKDEAILVQLPAMQVFHVDNIGTSFDAVLILHDQSCANELACSDSFPNESLDVTNLAAGTYMIIIDGWFNAAGPWTVNIGGAIAPGGACDGALATAGVIGCGAGYGCVGGICVGTAECNNGVDDDGDGAPGFPTDPGCASPIDATEADDCPAGPGCPQCGNIGDDDGDGDVDYPADADCASASDDDESPPACVQEQDPIETIVGGTTTGSTVGTSNDFVLSCDFSFSQASGEVVLTLDLPAMESVSVDQLGTSYDAILGLFEPTCANELGCADFGGIDLVNVAAGTYSVVMDGWGGAEGPYTVNVSGVIAPLGACDGVLASSGAITLPGRLHLHRRLLPRSRAVQQRRRRRRRRRTRLSERPGLRSGQRQRRDRRVPVGTELPAVRQRRRRRRRRARRLPRRSVMHLRRRHQRGAVRLAGDLADHARRDPALRRDDDRRRRRLRRDVRVRGRRGGPDLRADPPRPRRDADRPHDRLLDRDRPLGHRFRLQRARVQPPRRGQRRDHRDERPTRRGLRHRRRRLVHQRQLPARGPRHRRPGRGVHGPALRHRRPLLPREPHLRGRHLPAAVAATAWLALRPSNRRWRRSSRCCRNRSGWRSGRRAAPRGSAGHRRRAWARVRHRRGQTCRCGPGRAGRGARRASLHAAARARARRPLADVSLRSLCGWYSWSLRTAATRTPGWH